MRLHLLLVFLPLVASANERDPKLVGTWGLDGSSEITFELKADGTGSFDDAPVRWSASKGALRLRFEDEEETIRYALSGDVVTLEQDGEKQSWKRLGAAKPAGALARVKAKQQGEKLDPADLPAAERAAIEAALGAKKAPAPAKAGNVAKSAQDRKLAELLTSSAWCSFKYSSGGSYTGGSWSSSRTKRWVFTPDGRATLTTGGEGYNSGAYGSVASQRGGGQSGFWRFESGILHVSEDGVTFVPSDARLTYNSNGYPIWNADGEEFNMCD